MPDSGLNIVARRLREARERSGLSQKALGIAAGIDELSASPRVNQYERGKHVPDLLTLKHFAAVLIVPVPYFFAEDELLAEILALVHLVPRAEWAGIRKYLARKSEASTKKLVGPE